LNIGVSQNRFCDFLADPDSRNFSRFTLIFTGAGINWNDGFAGGSTVMGNLVFNMVRETVRKTPLFF
jgi:hypothetical protein